ncbi:GNAT family N-acetyltransferase [Sphingomonas sp.]|uniref:GNAT family N-acetyltransferase n=1 Tax=Sphingomonas sp. TaxID=28214 RepID=UPI002EDB40E6
MTGADVTKVADLAEAVHRDYPENAAVFGACFRLYPAGCHVVDIGEERIGGYLIAHPGRFDTPSVLDVPLERLPEPADCYYLHDLALAPAARGHGLAGAAVEIVIAEARRSGLDTLALIAVGDAHGFWRHQGFTPLDGGLLDPAKGYGPEARALIRRI